MTAISGAVSSNAGSVGRQAAVIVAATGLVLAAGLPAHGIGESERVVLSTPLNAAAVTVDEVSAPATAKITFERAAVKATPAPAKTAPVVEAKAEAVEPVEVVEAAAPAAPVVEPVQAVPAVAVQPAVEESAPVEAPVEAPAPAPAAAPAPAPAAPKAEAPKAEAPAAPSSNIAAGLVGSAYSQIGVAQDCTAMVEKALRSVGKSVGDIAPSGFFAFGSVVGSPAPGDLVITGGHVAIYVGNGQVISGGLNGMNTGLHSLSDLPGASFVRVS
nr:C40 family peptidase [Arthrobacter sp. 260]